MVSVSEVIGVSVLKKINKVERASLARTSKRSNYFLHQHGVDDCTLEI